MSQPPANRPAAQILVIDDEPDLRTLYELTLLREGHQVEAAASVAEARERLAARRFDVIITDMRLPDGLGLDILLQLQREQRPERCVVMTAYGSTENAVEALKAGAFDYLTKPVDLKQFRAVVASAVQGGPPEPAPTDFATATGAPASNAPDAPAPPACQQALDRMVGQSEALQRVKTRIVKAARGMAPVLVRGESGTGKELAAQAVHACSPRHGGPFVAVNCGAIPENLLEAEFFGARKGSYTGATQDRDGYFQAARGGTLFLDEIGDLPLAMQSKLLRAIQERSVRPLGSTQEDTVDVRIVSATHKDLQAEVQAGRFRQDLFYRLNVIELNLPALRERREDLPALCQALLARIGRESGLPVPDLAPAALRALAAHPLHGNVRELENILHRALALSEGEHLQLDGVLDAAASDAAPPPVSAPVAPAPPPAAAPAPSETVPPAPPMPAPHAAAPAAPDLIHRLNTLEREILGRVLHEVRFDPAAAAYRLGLTPGQLRHRMTRLDLAPPATPHD